MDLTRPILITCLVLAGSPLAIAQNTAPASAECTPTSSPSPTPTEKREQAPPGQRVDRRRLAPTVGTGGSIGGPTGLFTIYDGQTLHWKESTFSLAFSNFDRDPGNANITEVPFSLQSGLTDNIEFFITNVAYRAIRVNNPQNLSSFYLPNSLLPFGGRGPATVLAPFNNLGLTGALFRPANNQPFVSFPFIGQPSGNFGNATFNGTLGVQGSGRGLFGAAANFPGIGSVYGSILPGIVLSTSGPANNTRPVTFTLAPSYLPDAPFTNHHYGQSSFSETKIGLKIRLPFSTKNTGIGFVPFYRFYRDGANSASGFNQLQRGASPGGSFGDFGGVVFVDHRFKEYLNVSANIGYTFNSNPRSTAFGGGTATLLDRSNELTAGIGFDFPLKKYLQLIAEVRSTSYVGGHTPNAFQNNPVDTIAGARFFFSDSIGFGIAYRRHLNEQSAGRINGNLPSGFAPSTDPNGFILQFWFGRHFPRYRQREFEHELKVDFNYTLIMACPTGSLSASGSCPACTVCTQDDPTQTPCFPPDGFDGKYVTIRALPDTASSKNTFVWHTESGTPPVEGSGKKVRWDISALPQDKRFIVSVDISNPAGQKTTTKVYAFTVKQCRDCATPSPSPIPSPTVCPTGITVTAEKDAPGGATIKFSAVVADYDARNVSYDWSVSAGAIISGQNASAISVDTTGLCGTAEAIIVATVKVAGLDPKCSNTAQAQTVITCPEPPECKAFDSYGTITYNDEKARLDNFAIQLKDPGIQAFIIAYRGLTNPTTGNIGTRKLRVVGDICPEYRFNRALNYLVQDRGVDRSRIHYIDGGDRSESSVELWVCSANKIPTAIPDSKISRASGACINRGIPVPKKGHGQSKAGHKKRKPREKRA